MLTIYTFSVCTVLHFLCIDINDQKNKICIFISQPIAACMDIHYRFFFQSIVQLEFPNQIKRVVCFFSPSFVFFFLQHGSGGALCL